MSDNPHGKQIFGVYAAVLTPRHPDEAVDVVALRNLIEFLLDKTRLLDRLRGQLNTRQEKGLLRMLREGPDGFKGGLSAGKYSTITGASPATVTRDLADLTEKGALIRTGERRHARYSIGIPLRVVQSVQIDKDGSLSEA